MQLAQREPREPQERPERLAQQVPMEPPVGLMLPVALADSRSLLPLLFLRPIKPERVLSSGCRIWATKWPFTTVRWFPIPETGANSADFVGDPRICVKSFGVTTHLDNKGLWLYCINGFPVTAGDFTGGHANNIMAVQVRYSIRAIPPGL